MESALPSLPLTKKAHPKYRNTVRRDTPSALAISACSLMPDVCVGGLLPVLGVGDKRKNLVEVGRRKERVEIIVEN